MAHTKSGGSTQYGRDSESKRLGVKLFAGELARPGNIIIRQRGTRFIAGTGMKRAGDDSLYALREGVVKFSQKIRKSFNGARKKITQVEIR